MTLQLKVPNITCSACKQTITKAIKAIDPTATIQTGVKTKLVKIETQASQIAVKEAITAVGYSVASSSNKE